MKSGKSTVSLTYLGKSYRFFEEIRRVKIGCAAPNFASLKTTSSLSKFTQTWREKQANSSDIACFSGKLLRHDNKTRLLRYVGAGLSFKPSCRSSTFAVAARLPQVALCAEVGLANVIVVQEFLASSVLSNLAKFKNVRAVSNLKCHVSILLDQQNGGSCIT